MGLSSGFDVAFGRDAVQLSPKHRRLLLLGTALGSTLIVLSASPSFAANCTQPASPSPITVTGAATPISCTNTVPRTATVAGDNAIGIVTTGNGNTVDITNSGLLTTDPGSLIAPPPGGSFSQSKGARGIYAGTNGIGADITIKNTGTINSFSDSIKATDGVSTGTVFSSDTHISITNSGTLTAGPNAEGIFALATYGSNNVVTVNNSGAIQTGANTTLSGTSSGIFTDVGGDNGQVNVTNSGTIDTIGTSAAGISAIASFYHGNGSSIVIDNKAGGTITATGDDAYGIFAQAGRLSNVDTGGTVKITNAASVTAGYMGIAGFTYGKGGDITIANTGNIINGSGHYEGADGIKAGAYGSDSIITITNSGAIDNTAGDNKSMGIEAIGGSGSNVKVSITNSGDITSGNGTATYSDAIKVTTTGSDATVTINNSGDLDTTAGGNKSDGIQAVSGSALTTSNVKISITNSGEIRTGENSVGIFANAGGLNAVATVNNSGEITTGTSVSISGGSSGIFADVDGENGQVNVTNNGAISTTGYSAAGISTIANYYNGDNGRIVIDNKAGGTITSTGLKSYGIAATAGSLAPFPPGTPGNPNDGGTIKITNAASISAGYVGIDAATYGNGGDITINNKGNIKSGTAGHKYSDGIEAKASSGNTNINVTNSGAIDTTSGGVRSVGIQAWNSPTFGLNNTDLHISVTNSGDITTGINSVGIFARSYGAGGQVTVDNSGKILTGSSIVDNGGSTGIFADVNGNNSQVNVTNNGAITTSGINAAGISAIANFYGVSDGNVIQPTSGGSVVVNNKAGGTITTTGSDAFGIFAQAGRPNPVGQGPNLDDGGTVMVTNAATINSGGKGIGAYTYGSDGTVTVTNKGDIYSTNEEGIYAESNGANSNVTVTNSGSVNAYSTAAALAAYTSGANSNIVINNTGENSYIYGSGNAVVAETTGPSSSITITNGGSIYSDSKDGINAKSSGADSNIIINTEKNSSVYGANYAIVAETTGAASTITVTTDGDVYGEQGGIKVNSTGGATVNVGTTGYVGGDNYLAIKSTVGTVEINDNGVIAGRVELSDAGNVMNIDEKGTFRAFTNSTFGAGDDTLNNSGVVNASGSYFGSSPNTVTLSGLENFINGSLGSGPGLTTMIDGVVGDKLTTSGNFTGQGNSKLGVDANFLNNTSDTLTIGGNSYGHTNLVVNVTAIAPGVPTATFIPVVTVTGTTSDSNFDVPAPVNAGLFAYDLFLQGQTHGLRYVGLGNAAFELPAGVTGAQNVWQDTTGFWQDRMADLRTEATGTHNADMPEENLKTRMGGIWARASGDWSSQDGDTSYTDPISQQTETLNLDRRQQTGAFLGGIDMGLEGVAGGDMLFGVMGGYVTSKLDFKATDDSWNYKGGTVGAYATYLNGGFYLDGLVKADFLNVDINDSQGAISDKASTNATNIGVRLDTGYRVATSWGFVEPQASLEWVHTSMDSVSIFGGDIDFQNGSSGRARIGVRVGTDMQMNGMTVSPDLTLSVWNHFGSSNSVSIDFPGNAFSATDSVGNGTFGEVGVGVNVASASNWSGVVRGSVRFGNHYSAGSIGAALRYGW